MGRKFVSIYCSLHKDDPSLPSWLLQTCRVSFGITYNLLLHGVSHLMAACPFHLTEWWIVISVVCRLAARLSLCCNECLHEELLTWKIIIVESNCWVHLRHIDKFVRMKEWMCQWMQLEFWELECRKFHQIYHFALLCSCCGWQLHMVCYDRTIEVRSAGFTGSIWCISQSIPATNLFGDFSWPDYSSSHHSSMSSMPSALLLFEVASSMCLDWIIVEAASFGNTFDEWWTKAVPILQWWHK